MKIQWQVTEADANKVRMFFDRHKYSLFVKNRIILSLIICLFLFPTLLFAGQYKVIRVIDGDTILIDYKGNQERVRLLSVNTPESVHPDKKQNITMGKIASQYTKERLRGKSVDLEFEGERRDRYDRLLAYIIVDGSNFNLELVNEGLSPYYTQYGLSQKYDREFRSAEKLARKNGLNIWGDPELTQKYLRLKSKWGQGVSQNKSSSNNVVQKVEAKYVASKTSDVFHRPDCKWVKKIKPTNFIEFDSRDEAVKSGRRPCKTCNP